MNAIEFIESLKNSKRKFSLNFAKEGMTANEFFDTVEGLELIDFLSDNTRIIDKETFELIDFNVISTLKNDPVYKKRKFFCDMCEIGFLCSCLERPTKAIPIGTYLFEAVAK